MICFDDATFLYHAREPGADDMTCKGRDPEKVKAVHYKGCYYLQQKKDLKKESLKVKFEGYISCFAQQAAS